MSGSSHNHATTAVTRGGTGTTATPANSAVDPTRGESDSAGVKDRPDVARGTEKESIMDKIRRTSDSGIGKDTASKATSFPERFGFPSSGRGADYEGHGTTGPSLIGKTIDKAGSAVSNVGATMGATAGTARDRVEDFGSGTRNVTTTTTERRASNTMSGREMTTDFLGNYSQEMRDEIGGV